MQLRSYGLCFAGVVDGVQDDFADGAVGQTHVFEEIENAGAVAGGNQTGAGFLLRLAQLRAWVFLFWVS